MLAKIDNSIVPVVLFTLFVDKHDSSGVGVYYAPQYGVVMENVYTYGSSKEVARYIQRHEEFSFYEPGEIDPGELSQSAIVSSINKWLNSEFDENATEDYYCEDEYSVDDDDVENMTVLQLSERV